MRLPAAATLLVLAAGGPFILAAGAPLMLAGPAAAADCLRADGGDQVVEGKLVVRQVRDYTRKFVPTYFLDLRQAACLDGADDVDKVEATKTIHVYSLEAPMRSQLKAQVGRQVRVTGRPSGQVSYHHHHAPIVLQATAIERR